MRTDRLITFTLHVAGLLLLTVGTVLLFESTESGSGALDRGATFFANPVFILAGFAGLVSGCDCLRRAVTRQGH